MAQKLSVQIALEGGKEVERQLAAMGEEGQKAFQKIDQAAQQAGGFRNLKMGDVTAQLKEMGITGVDSINQIKQAVRTAGKFEGIVAGSQSMERGLAKVAEGAQAASSGLANVVAGSRATNAAFGLTRRELGALRTTLRQVDLGTLGNQLTSFGRIGSAFGPVGIAIGAIGAAVAGVVVAFDKFANSAVETAKSLTQVVAAGKVSFDFMSSLQIAFAQGGTSLKTFANEIGNLQDKIAQSKDGGAALAASMDRVKQAVLSVEEAELSLAEAQLKARRSTGQLTEAEQKRFNKQRQILALEEAEARVAHAKQQRDEAAANNLDDLVRQFNNISEGVKETFDPLTTLESKVKAITTLLASVSDEDQFLKLADIFKHLSLLEQTQIGKALGLSPETIQTLSKGSQAIRNMQAEVVRLGLALDNLDNIDLDRLRASQSNLAALWDALKNKMGALASPAFTSFWEGLTSRIKQLIPEFLRLAEAFGGIDLTALGESVANFALWLAKVAVDVTKVFAAFAEGDTSALDAALASIKEKFSTMLSSLGQIISNALGRAISAVLDSALGEGFTNKLLGFLSLIKTHMLRLSAMLSGDAAAAGQEAGKAFGEALIAAITDAIANAPKIDFSRLLSFGKTLGEFSPQGRMLELIKQIFGSLTTPAGAAEAGGGQPGGMDFGPMIAAAEVAAVRIQQVFATAATDISATFSQIDIASALGQQIDILTMKFVELAQAAAAAARAAAAIGVGGGGGGGGELDGLARGGLFGGRGTGTSDSNLAWLSRGEYITPARAVAQPGVLAFLEALRRSGGNLSRVLDGMGRFALGGMVPRSMGIPAFAAGGLNGGSNVTIQFPGLPPISGLRASSDVVDQLHKAAALAQVRSGGRKPSRYT